MIREEIVIAVCNDISGQTRGKGFPLKERKNRFQKGIGWVPTNVQITCFNSIADSPYGSVDDLVLVPDQSTEVAVDYEDDSPSERFVIGDILHLDGKPWNCCTRNLAKAALAELHREAGVHLYAAFEQEFIYSGVPAENWHGFGLAQYRAGANFGQTFVAALRKAGLVPDMFLPEYGAGQFEGTLKPAIGIRSADECVIFREIARATAHRFGHSVCFAPLVDPASVGNGVHIHFSFFDDQMQPLGYDGATDNGLGPLMERFCAGVLKYMPAISALMAAGVPSYLRLTPHRWSAAFNNLAVRDREAGLRICPINSAVGENAASQFNIEYRAADATASPYVQLAALVQSGLQGIRDELPPPKPTSGDLSLLDDSQLAAIGVRRLPTSLKEALDEMAAQPILKQWFFDEFVDIYIRHKNQEIDEMSELDPVEICRRYAVRY